MCIEITLGLHEMEHCQAVVPYNGLEVGDPLFTRAFTVCGCF